MSELWLFLAGLVAGLVNAIAGGGPLLTLAALTAAGIDPRTANLTSTVALCPGQLIAGWRARRALVAVAGKMTGQTALLALALAGGAIGGLLLLWTPRQGFAAMVPWLVLLATALYAWGGRRGGRARHRLGLPLLLSALALSSIYGGYFGGGNSFVVLALLGLAGLGEQDGANAKNVIIASINLGAVLVFVPSGEIAWTAAVAVGLGGMAGSWAGSWLLPAIRPAVLRPLIIACGLLLAAWYFAA